MLKGRRFYTNLFSPMEYEKTDKIILKGLRLKKYFVLLAVSMENLKPLMYHTRSKKN